ncbi:hypothetical protein LZ554_004386 [Drepanopeziza brunnea f. sp. 'monogermtubi']|nr:hypothetical protein LZ554_004386 [Drepanopeziza brunnea f. sp. 'monogermtubi']
MALFDKQQDMDFRHFESEQSVTLDLTLAFCKFPVLDSRTTDTNPEPDQTLSQTGSVGHHVPAPREKTRPDSPQPYTGELETRPERRHSQRSRHVLPPPPLKKTRPDSPRPRPYMARAETAPENNTRKPPMRGAALTTDPRRWGRVSREDGTEVQKMSHRRGDADITSVGKLGSHPGISLSLSPSPSSTGCCCCRQNGAVSVPVPMQASGGSTPGRDGKREMPSILPPPPAPPLLRSATSPPSLPVRGLRRVPRNSNLNGRSPRDL